MRPIQRRIALVLSLLLVVGAMMLFFMRGSSLPPVSRDGIPIPFGNAALSLQGRLSTIGQKGDVSVVDLAFAGAEIVQRLPAESVVFVVTPDSDAVSHGSPLQDVLTSGKKFYGYKYTSVSATVERDRRAYADAHPEEPAQYAQLFPGQFFASDLTDAFVIGFTAQHADVTFLPLADVSLERNARYILVPEEQNIMFATKAGPVCGNAVKETGEACDDGNSDPNDGCNAACTTVKSGWSCTKNTDAYCQTMKSAASSVGYDASLGTFPEAQGWMRRWGPNTTYASVVGHFAEGPVKFITLTDQSRTAPGPAYSLVGLDESDLSDHDWTMEITARIRSSSSTLYSIGMNMFIEKHGGKYTGIYFDTGRIGPLGPYQGGADPYPYARMYDMDTRGAFHAYRINYKANGTGEEDDTFDLSVDGNVVMADVRRDEVYTASEWDNDFGSLMFGIETSDGTGIMDVSFVRFSSGVRCGNGITEPAGADRNPGTADDEQCDDGNQTNTDTCTNACTSARCGDGVIQPLGADNQSGGGDDEECDDGANNGTPGSLCRSVTEDPARACTLKAVAASTFDDWVIFSAPKPAGPAGLPPQFTPASTDPVTDVVWALISYGGNLMSIMDNGQYYNSQYDSNLYDYDDSLTWHTDWQNEYVSQNFDGSTWNPAPFPRMEGTDSWGNTRPFWGASPFVNAEDGKLYFIGWGKTLGTSNALGYLRRFTNGAWEMFLIPGDADDPQTHELRLPAALDRGTPSGAGFLGKIWITGSNHNGSVHLLSFDEATKQFTYVPMPAGTLSIGGKLAVFSGRLWYIGQSTIYSTSDGTAWSLEAPAPWPASGYDTLPFVHDGKFWVIKGTGIFVSDDGRTWNDVTSEFPLAHPANAVVNHLGGLWIDAGGPSIPVSQCGDGDINGWDLCDGTNLNGKTCADVGYGTGTLACIPPGTAQGCTFDTTGCDYHYKLRIQQEGMGDTVPKGSTNVTLASYRLSASEDLAVQSLDWTLVSEDSRVLQNITLWTDVNDDGVMEQVKRANAYNPIRPTEISFSPWNPEELANGILQRLINGEHVIELRADIKTDTTASSFTLQGYTPNGQNQLPGYNPFIEAKDASGNWIGGTTMNGVRCTTTPCDVSMDTYDTTWNLSN